MPAPERPAVDPLPWVRFHWKDWRSSTARASLPLLARLAYLELIFAHNSSPDCTVPDDPRLLAALVDLPLRTWNRLAVYILPHVPVVSPGKRQNPRCFEEWKKGMNAREAAIEAGRRGGRSRASRARVAKGSLEGGFRVAQASLKPSASAACSEASSQKSDAGADLGALVGPPVAPTREAEPTEVDATTVDPARHLYAPLFVPLPKRAMPR